MMADLPRISVVTPNFNQAPFLEQTLESVVSQDYPNLDYIVMDGGSNDGSVEIIRRYVKSLSYWESASDKGQYDAVTRGFARATGEVMGWINSDDIYLPWTLQTVGEIFRDCPDVTWITSLTQPQIGETETWTGVATLAGVSRESFLDGRHLGQGFRNSGYIQQEATFWRRSLWKEAGGVAGNNSSTAGDFELWCNFLPLSEICGVAQPLAAFRSRPGQRSQELAERYRIESRLALAKARVTNGYAPSLRSILVDLLYATSRLRPAVAKRALGYCGQVLVKKEAGWTMQNSQFL